MPPTLACRFNTSELAVLRIVADAEAVSLSLRGTAIFRRDYFAGGRTDMAHWRKRNPTAIRFNSYLARGALLLTVVLGTLVIIARHYA